MFVNDILDCSDFYVRLSAPNGTWLADMLHDGFRSPHDPPRAPLAGCDMAWRTATYDLSAFKGQNVRLVFEKRNLHHGQALGIWTVVDDVRVVDAGPAPEPPGPYRAYLAEVLYGYVVCDAMTYGLGAHSIERPMAP